MAIAHAQQRDCDEVTTGRLAADRQHLGAELSLAVFDEPSRGRLAIIGTRRIRIFRGQPVFRSDNRLPGVVGDPFQHRILHIGAAEHPAAAVQMQVNPAR
jgi:hypothetical protein